MSNNINIHRAIIGKKVKDNDPRIDDRQFIPQQLKDVAKGLEKQFAEHMVQEMSKSIARTQDDSTASEYYQNLMIEERAKMLTESNKGLGFQDLILDQIYPKKFRNAEALQAYNQQRAPLKKPSIEMAGPSNDSIAIKNKHNAIEIHGKENSHE